MFNTKRDGEVVTYVKDYRGKGCRRLNLESCSILYLPFCQQAGQYFLCVAIKIAIDELSDSDLDKIINYY